MIINELLVFHTIFFLQIDGKLWIELFSKLKRELLDLSATWVLISLQTKVDDSTQDSSITASNVDGLVWFIPVLLVLVVSINDTRVSTHSACHSTWSDIAETEISEERPCGSKFSVFSSVVVVFENRNIQACKDTKNQAKAFVDNKNNDGPDPSCLAIYDVSLIQPLIGTRVPRLSVTLNGTYIFSPFWTTVLDGCKFSMWRYNLTSVISVSC